MRSLPALALLCGLAGCKRDPVLIGFWDVTAIRIDGVDQPDWGTMEMRADGKLQVIARYAWTGSGFEPLAQPEHWETTTDGGEQTDYFEVYEEEGEVHTVSFGYDVYRIEDYVGSSCRLVGAEVSPPGEEPHNYDDLAAAEGAPRVEVVYSLAR